MDFDFGQVLSIPKMIRFKECLDDVKKNKVEGIIVECGVYWGKTASIILKFAESDRKIFLFDTFKGLPKPLECDYKFKHQNQTNRYYPEGYLECSKEVVIQNLKQFKREYYLVEGLIEKMWPVIEGVPIAFLHLDMDYYSPTRCGLENFYPNITKGGWLIIDDYYCFEGCRKAVKEYFGDIGFDSEKSSQVTLKKR